MSKKNKSWICLLIIINMSLLACANKDDIKNDSSEIIKQTEMITMYYDFEELLLDGVEISLQADEDYNLNNLIKASSYEQSGV